MSSSRKNRRSKKPKKLLKKSKSAASNAEPSKSVSTDDDNDDRRDRLTLPFNFRPASIKFRKKRTRAINNSATNHRRSKSLPSIPIADEIYEAHPLGKLNKLTTLYNIDDVEIIDCRCDSSSEDENLQLWYEESKVEALDCHSDDEVKPRIKPFAFADIGGDKQWLDDVIAEPYASDVTLRDRLTRPYFDAEYESFKRHNWILISHERANHLPKNRQIVFKVLTKNRPRNILTHLRLGYCVTYTGPCPFGQTCQNYCSICGICRHQYHCSCRRNKRFGWCWHMHAAVSNGKCKFTEELTVYVANSNKYMQLAHIRASCCDSLQNVNQMGPNLFRVQENSSPVEKVNFMYLVRHLAGEQRCKCLPYKRCPECDICRHTYSCNCIEYENGNLCEHCHLVAMHLSGWTQNNKGDFYYVSDCSSEDEDEKEKVRQEEAAYEEQMRQVVMIHERSNSISLKRIEAFLEPPDDMICYTVNRTGGREPYFIEDKREYHSCNCRDLAEAVVCPACRLCEHQMICCEFISGECDCKHLHAIRRFLKVQFNADFDKRYGDETQRKYSDKMLLERRQEREIKRQRTRYRSAQIPTIDSMRNGEKKCTLEVLQNESTPLQQIAKIGISMQNVSKIQLSPLKKTLQNELSLSEKRSQRDKQESTGLADSCQRVAVNVEMQLAPVCVVKKPVADKNSESKAQSTKELTEDPVIGNGSLNQSEDTTLDYDLPKKMVEEKNELKSNTTLVVHSADSLADTRSTSNDSDLANFLSGTSATPKEVELSSAFTSTRQSDYVATFENSDSERVSSGMNKSKSQVSHKSSSKFGDNGRLEEKLTRDKVATKFEPQFSSVIIDRPENELGTFQQDMRENGLNVVKVKLKRTGTHLTEEEEDTKLESDMIKTDEPKIDSGTKTFKNSADAFTQTDLADRITVSTQTSHLDFADQTTTNSAAVGESKKKRKTKTQRKQLKQSVVTDGLFQTPKDDFTQNKISVSKTPTSGNSLEVSENNANECKESSLKASLNLNHLA